MSAATNRQTTSYKFLTTTKTTIATSTTSAVPDDAYLEQLATAEDSYQRKTSTAPAAPSAAAPALAAPPTNTTSTNTSQQQAEDDANYLDELGNAEDVEEAVLLNRFPDSVLLRPNTPPKEWTKYSGACLTVGSSTYDMIKKFNINE